MAFIRCPGCEDVHDLTAEPFCPNCRRCACCGEKVPADQPVCRCGYPDDPAQVAKVERNWAVPPSLVQREKRRYAIRKRLAGPRALTFNILLAVVMGVAVPLILDVRGITCFALFAFWVVTMLLYWSTDVLFWWMETRRLDKAPAGEPPQSIQPCEFAGPDACTPGGGDYSEVRDKATSDPDKETPR